jgi:gluconate kinase
MEACKPGTGHDVVIATCSALRAEYRGDLRELEAEGVRVTFLALQAGIEVLMERLEGRVGHYMKGEMVGGGKVLTRLNLRLV